MQRYAATIFLSAFLLFQVQPMIARVILPWYGGTAAVWTTCMLFFQIMLLAGYSYAHLLQRWSARVQSTIHLTLLAAAVIFCGLVPYSGLGAHPLPPGIMPKDSWKPIGGEEPVQSILLLLLKSVGLPYFVVSTTGPLLQAWFAREFGASKPYRLYALSNLGSLLALFTYPVVFEVYWPLHVQTFAWSLGFGVFAALCATCALRMAEAEVQLAQSPEPTRREEGETAATPPHHYLLWVLLSMGGSLVFLSSSNQMLQDIPPIPFLWILPLAAYLLSFILCFDSDKVYWRPLWGVLVAAAVAIAWHVVQSGVEANIALQVVAYTFACFVLCMACHGELASLRPPPSRLTLFFLLVSVGGMLGGLVVGIVAPLYFKGHWEYPLTLVFVVGLLILLSFIESKGLDGITYWLGAVALAGLLSWEWRFHKFSHVHDLWDENFSGTGKGVLHRSRNFFGVLTVKEKENESDAGEPDGVKHQLSNGRIDHGFQFQMPAAQRWHTTYYGEQSGVGLAINHHARNSGLAKQRGLRIGAVGLGTGTLATYAEKGDAIRFYDINPQVEKISNEFFTHRKNAISDGADVQVVLGDARISMERELKEEKKQDFDVVVLDAFSSDSIPMHLLTKESIELYKNHLRDKDGILAIHISNRYLNLEPVCRAAADAVGMKAVTIENEREGVRGVYSSTWVLLTNSDVFLTDPEVVDAERSSTGKGDEEARKVRVLWTDDYSNLFRVVEWDAVRKAWDPKKLAEWLPQALRERLFGADKPKKNPHVDQDG